MKPGRAKWWAGLGALTLGAWSLLPGNQGPTEGSLGARDLRAPAGSFEERDQTRRWRPPRSLDPVRPAAVPADLSGDGGVEVAEAPDAPEPTATQDDTPAQHSARHRYVAEQSDPNWTKRVTELVSAQSGGLLEQGGRAENVDCKQTVCRMYLTFSTDADATLFFENGGLQLEGEPFLHALGPGADEESTEGYAYEVMLVREWTRGPVASAPTGELGDTLTVVANQH